MNRGILDRLAAATIALVAVCASAALRADEIKLPAPASQAIDFGRDIRPIFAAHCHQCHGSQKQESGFRLDRREAALGGADRGDPPIIPGKSAESPLVHFVAGADRDMLMPPKGE